MRYLFVFFPSYLGFSSAPGGPFSVLHYGKGCIDYWSKFEEAGAFSLVAALQFKGHENPFPQSACLYEWCYPTWMRTSLPRFSIDVYICVLLYTLLTGIKTYVQNQANTEIEMWRQLLDLLVYAARPLKKKKKKTKMWSHHTHTVLMKQISGDFEC